MDLQRIDLIPNPREINVSAQSTEIYVTITIGNGQLGASKISQGTTPLMKGDLSKHTYLGSVTDLAAAPLEFRTNVLDVNQSTNKCVISTQITDQNNTVLYAKTDNGDAPVDGIASFVGNYVVKILSVFALFFFSLTGDVLAQDDLSFQNLQTPASPGFILLDQTPSAIESPTTPQGFGASALGVFSAAGGAMDFAPYWLTDHINLKAEDMYKKHCEFLQNFTVSLAHVVADSIGYVSFGGRTRLFRTYGKKQIAKLDSLKTALIMLLADVDETSSLDQIETLRAAYASLILKPVFSIDIAGATAGFSPTNSYNDLQSSRWGVWATLNYRPKGDDFYVSVVGRYIGNNRFGTYANGSNSMDIGARLNYDIGKLSISMEYLQRSDLKTTSNKIDNRLVGIGSYQLSDKFYLTATIGKDFGEVDNMIAMGGVNFGFSKSKVKAF